MEENKSEQSQPANFDWVVPEEGTPQIYGNIFNVSWTLFDVRLQIGQLVPTAPGPSATFVAKEKAALILSWGQVKIVRDAFIDLIRRYEEANGEIKPVKLPPNT